MGIRSVLVAIIGVAVAGGSVYAARVYIDASAASASASADNGLVTVVVAARDIPYGQEIQPQMLQNMQWPREALPVGAMTEMADLVPLPGQAPRRAKRALAQGELILASKISEYGEKVTIVQSLGENTRAMAIKVDAETAVGGFVTPGDTVDILLTQGRDNLMQAVTILQNVRVVGVDQVSDEQSDAPEIARTVTVEVSPEQGQKLALAQKAGTLSLTLRSLDRALDAPLDSIKLSDLLLEKSPVEDAAVKTTVRVRRANVIETVDVN